MSSPQFGTLSSWKLEAEWFLDRDEGFKEKDTRQVYSLTSTRYNGKPLTGDPVSQWGLR